MSNKEVGQIVKEFYLQGDPEGCAKRLVEEATARWERVRLAISNVLGGVPRG